MARSKEKMQTKKYDAAFPEYTGNLLWDVRHPDYPKSIRVLAPSVGNKTNEACIMVAASYWGRRWQDINFYANCECSRVYNTEVPT